MSIAAKFNVYDIKEHCYLKTDCILEDIIPAYHRLTNNEVRKYFKINEDNRHWERAHNSSSVRRYVFDKCIVPDHLRYRIEPTGSFDYEED